MSFAEAEISSPSHRNRPGGGEYLELSSTVSPFLNDPFSIFRMQVPERGAAAFRILWAPV